PVVIHRAIYGSFERFIGILIEHFAGNFPVWLAPEQARIIPVHEDQLAWAEEVAKRLQAADLRVSVDLSNDTFRAKIREAQLAKVPYTLVIGKKEVEAQGVDPRTRGTGKEAELGLMTLDVFLERIKREAAIPY
ncbi:MAG: His/Gly/Thr/Pro-type tRNA ligase C-terminal domain-containing protein, partial [Acidobacteriota bacterium]